MAMPMEPGVYWRVKNKAWKPYKQDVALKILVKYFEWLNSALQSTMPLDLGERGWHSINFGTMKLKSRLGRYDRSVKIILAPVEDELIKLMDAKFLESTVLPYHSGITFSQIHPNKLSPATKIYKKFVRALQCYATLHDKSILDEMRQAVNKCNISSLKSLEFVFHGSWQKNISSILKRGLDPKKAKDSGFGPFLWVGKTPRVSWSYCGCDPRTMVLFLELKNHGESDWTWDGRRSVPLNKSHVLLPVAKLVINSLYDS